MTTLEVIDLTEECVDIPVEVDLTQSFTEDRCSDNEDQCSSTDVDSGDDLPEIRFMMNSAKTKFCANEKNNNRSSDCVKSASSEKSEDECSSTDVDDNFDDDLIVIDTNNAETAKSNLEENREQINSSSSINDNLYHYDSVDNYDMDLESRLKSIRNSEIVACNIDNSPLSFKSPSTSDANSQSSLNSPRQSSNSCASTATSSTCSSPNKAKRKRLTNEEQELRANEREKKRLEKEEEKLRKKREKEAIARRKALEKAEKANQRVILRSQKPGECMKYINVVMEESIVQTGMGAKLMSMLQDAEVAYRFEKFAIEKMIMWQRERPEASQGREEERNVEEDSEERFIVVLLPVKDFVRYVYRNTHEDVDDINLTQYISQLQDNLLNKSLTIVVQGLEKYLRDVKTLNQRNYRNNVQTASGVNDGAKRPKKLKVDYVITRLELEQSLVELELTTDVNFKFTETDEESAKFVYCMTKAIAEAPFKQARQETDFSFVPDNKNVIKVNKDGVGLRKLWTNQFLQFHNVSPDIANAITAQFPSPVALMQAYASAASRTDAELLLADIKVRRGAGVLETSRRIGRELSRRVYELMTSDDPNFVLQ